MISVDVCCYSFGKKKIKVKIKEGRKKGSKLLKVVLVFHFLECEWGGHLIKKIKSDHEVILETLL